jgi:hypothetical protein
VRTRELPEGRLRLSFEPVVGDAALEVLRVEEARTVLAAFQESFRVEERPRPRARFALVSTGEGEGRPAGWESRLREEYLARYGPPLLPLPPSLERSPLVLALKLSPRYMGAGVREAAEELFSSPVFLSSVALSVLMYFSAWLAPEPIFTKAFDSLRRTLDTQVRDALREGGNESRCTGEPRLPREPPRPTSGGLSLGCPPKARSCNR